jgi:hypothetical protein
MTFEQKEVILDAVLALVWGGLACTLGHYGHPVLSLAAWLLCAWTGYDTGVALGKLGKI